MISAVHASTYRGAKFEPREGLTVHLSHIPTHAHTHTWANSHTHTGQAGMSRPLLFLFNDDPLDWSCNYYVCVGCVFLWLYRFIQGVRVIIFWNKTDKFYLKFIYIILFLPFTIYYEVRGVRKNAEIVFYTAECESWSKERLANYFQY